MDPDLNELLVAAGAVMQRKLNILPHDAKLAIQGAVESGGWTELRIGFSNNCAYVIGGVANLDGKFAEAFRTDFSPTLGH